MPPSSPGAADRREWRNRQLTVDYCHASDRRSRHPGLPMFELAIPCEVFEPGRQDFPVPWWYELQLCAVQDGPVRTAEGLLFDSPLGLDELTEADTVIIPGCADRQGDPPQALLRGPARRLRSRRADRLHLHRRLHPGRGRAARRAHRDHPLDARGRAHPALAGRPGRAQRALHRRRPDPHLGRIGRRARPVPAHRQQRPRDQGRQHARPAARHSAASRRRSGAVHRAAAARQRRPGPRLIA